MNPLHKRLRNNLCFLSKFLHNGGPAIREVFKTVALLEKDWENDQLSKGILCAEKQMAEESQNQYLLRAERAERELAALKAKGPATLEQAMKTEQAEKICADLRMQLNLEDARAAQAERACAEMRKVLGILKKEIGPKGHLHNLIDHALSADAGRGYFSREQLQPLVDALRFVAEKEPNGVDSDCVRFCKTAMRDAHYIGLLPAEAKSAPGVPYPAPPLLAAQEIVRQKAETETREYSITRKQLANLWTVRAKLGEVLKAIQQP